MQKKLVKNEVGCRDDTVPKTGDTRRHCEVELTVFRNPPPYISFFGGCGRLLHTVHSTSQCLLVSPVFGTVSSLHPTSFLMIFILVHNRNYANIKYSAKTHQAKLCTLSQLLVHMQYWVRWECCSCSDDHMPHWRSAECHVIS